MSINSDLKKHLIGVWLRHEKCYRNMERLLKNEVFGKKKFVLKHILNKALPKAAIVNRFVKGNKTA